MFLEFYQLQEQPFGVTPDPRFLYFSQSHREALASLSYGIETGRGFLAFIAKPGMGKTTLLFHLLENLRNSARTAFLFQTQCDSRELFRYLMADLRLDTKDQDVVRMHNQLNEVLLREAQAGKRVVLIIDEAQNLEDSVLETVRLLSDFETPRAKLLQIILAGQPELADKLARPGLLQLKQRIATLTHLDPLTPEEANCYIDHRLSAAGYTSENQQDFLDVCRSYMDSKPSPAGYKGYPLFTADARKLIVEHSGGIPRIINHLCFNALSLGYALKKKRIDAAIVKEVVADMDVVPLVSEQHAPHEPVPPSPPAAPPLSYLPIRQSAFGRAALYAVALAALFFLVGSFSISFLAGKPDRTTSERASPPASPLLLKHPFNSSSEKGLDGPVLAAPPVSQRSLSRDRGDLTVESESLSPSVSEAEDSSVKPLGAARRSPRVLTVVVKPYETLEKISFGYLGWYGPELAKQIRDLNPELKHTNRLAVGQRIRLPGGLDFVEGRRGLPSKTVHSKTRTKTRKGIFHE